MALDSSEGSPAGGSGSPGVGSLGLRFFAGRPPLDPEADPQQARGGGSPPVPRSVRRATWVLVATVVAAALAYTWPLFAVFAGASPRILGLPLSFAWVIAWLLAVFVALIACYRSQHR